MIKCLTAALAAVLLVACSPGGEANRFEPGLEYRLPPSPTPSSIASPSPTASVDDQATSAPATVTSVSQGAKAVAESAIAASTSPIRPLGPRLTLEELDEAGLAAGWPSSIWPDMRAIVQCETGGTLDPTAHNGSDPNSGSYGLAQLNGTQHFDRAGEPFEQWADPVVNLRVALWLYNARGRFGGSGGWYTCALKNGLD